MEYQELLQRFVGHRVCVSTFGHLKLWGKLTAVTEDCLRLVNTSVSNDGEDSLFSAHHYSDDDDTATGHRHCETLVHFHHIVAISCLDNDLPAITMAAEPDLAGESRGETGVVRNASGSPANARTWEQVDDPQRLVDEDQFQLLAIDRLELQVGTRLLPLIDPKKGGDLRERLSHLRNLISAQLGFLLPQIRIRDNLHLEPEEYRILVHGAEVARGTLEPQCVLALGGPHIEKPLLGKTVHEPAYSQPAIWIEPDLRETAQKAGYFTVEPGTVLVTHLQKEVRQHARELFPLDALRQYLEQVRRFAPAVVEELVPQRMSLARLHDLLTRLLEEEVSLRPLELILEKIAHLDPAQLDIEEMLVHVRIALGRILCERFRDREGQLALFSLERPLHDHVATMFSQKPGANSGRWISKFVGRLREWYLQRREQLGRDVPLVVDTLLRRKLALLLRQSIPGLTVLAFSEIGNEMPVDLIANLAHESLGLARPVSSRAPLKGTGAKGTGAKGSSDKATIATGMGAKGTATRKAAKKSDKSGSKPR